MKSLLNLFISLYNRENFQKVLGVFLIVIFTSAYIVLMLNRYWQFEYFSVDNVYFDTALWKLANFQAPMVFHPAFGIINIFGDHFHPTIILFAFLYRLFSVREIIFVGMGLVYGLSALFAMLIGFRLIKSRLLVYSLITAYFLYLGSQNAMIYGFHEINLMPLFFFVTVFAHIFNKSKLYWIGLILLLLTKESMSVVGISLGVFIFLSDRKQLSKAIFTICLSVFYYLIVTRYVIPSISGRFIYQVSTPSSFSDLIDRLTYPHDKIETFWVSVATFGLLPILNIATLPLVLQDFFLRYVFTIPGNIQYLLTYHYGVGLAPLLLFSSFWTIHLIQTRVKSKAFYVMYAIFIIVTTLYYHRIYSIKGPLSLVLNPAFYKITKDNKFLWKLVDSVPLKGSITTQNHLALVLSHNDASIFPVSKNFEDINTEFVVYDLRTEQNPNNYFPLSRAEMLDIVDKLLETKKYKIIYNQDQMYVLQKN